MAKLVLLLAFAQASLIHGAPILPSGSEFYDILDKRAITISTSIPITTSYSSEALSSVQTASPTTTPSVTGTVNTALPSGHNTQGPINTTGVDDTNGSLIPASETLKPLSLAGAPIVDNVFVPMATDAPPAVITVRDDHPLKPLNLKNKDNKPIETNKFYANLFLGTQTQPVWTHPYSLAWSKGKSNSYGLAVAHIERSQLAWADGNPPQYFIGPVGLQHVVFSAAELGDSTTLTTEDSTAFSVYANLAPSANSDPLISFPLVQGMGLVTAVYNKASPILTSGTFFRTLKYAGQVNGVTYKYQIQLEDNSYWVLYATPAASLGAPPFTLKDSSTIKGPKDFMGIIQVAKNPAADNGEKVYDAAAGSYAVGATIIGSVNDAAGSYTLDWQKEGIQNQTLVMFALPHHVEAFDQATQAALTGIELVTTTKGIAKAVAADRITMVEKDLPTTIGFGPWGAPVGGDGGSGSGNTDNTQLNQAALAAVNAAGALELNQDMIKQTSLDSMYYSGKGLAKFAAILYTMQDMARNSNLAAAGLIKLKEAFDVFITNKQPLPLVYDTTWKGVVSSGTYQSPTKDPGLDFGNTFYNDHHFHYGYFVWAAAVVGYLDPNWLTENGGANKKWVDMLVRDYSNPSDKDPYFPFTRSFDWFHGHSWAKGLFESGDGKDEESTSEDTFATYGLKMWGKVTGDAAMEARANLQLAVQARSLRNYFLLSSDNKVQPERFIPNKVTGVMFENKVDHTTYFGSKPEHIQGIHMIPLNPSSQYTRPKKFVQEEWDVYFSNGRADKAEGGWRGILYANLALVDPAAAFRFFADVNFNMGDLDGGASLTWYLAWTAGLGGASGLTVEDIKKFNTSQT
ncbi:glycoside hydrolase [Delitschia confertaspora ATCC 74209]|uniref:glucan endo-1,3-beta-D-glucosidase n=1 Tax=Delitschia confertaspora ATCC 74209 TaxID=1513339 RepID=A0A9P4JQI9_9PLEO|nr:glycoside hydrolase [Delitschia confertaspora ATCC 74209]